LELGQEANGEMGTELGYARGWSLDNHGGGKARKTPKVGETEFLDFGAKNEKPNTCTQSRPLDL